MDYDTLLFVSLDVIVCQYMKKLHRSFMVARYSTVWISHNLIQQTPFFLGHLG